MSRTRLFDPRSLQRVTEAVEWEDLLQEYSDGTTNQQRYMQALAILWERWMRGWSIPDFASVLYSVGNQQYAEAFVHILTSLRERISQLRGFWEGVWYGANPRQVGISVSSSRPLVTFTPEEMVRSSLTAFWDYLQELLKEE